MYNIKLAAIDLDGTLLTSEKKITPEDEKTIRRARELGIHIVFASGRHFDGVKTIIRMIGNTDYCISSVGALVTDRDEKLVYSNCLDPDYAHDLLVYLDSIGIYAQAYPPLQAFMCKKRCRHTYDYEKLCGCPSNEVPDLLERKNAEYTKILMVDKPEVLEELKHHLSEKYPGYPFLHSQADHLETINKTASKGVSLEFICNRLGITMDNVLSIGDEEIDLPMLETAGHSACPANSIGTVKENTEYISTKTNNENAITDIFNHYIFGEK